MRPPVVALMLTLLLGIQPITTDLYLPALPLLRHALGASVAATQLTLSVLALFGAATFGYIGWRFEETLPHRNPRATQLAPLLRNWTGIAAHPTFRAGGPAC